MRLEEQDRQDGLRRPSYMAAGDSLAAMSFLHPSFHTGLVVFLLSS